MDWNVAYPVPVAVPTGMLTMPVPGADGYGTEATGGRDGAGPDGAGPDGAGPVGAGTETVTVE